MSVDLRAGTLFHGRYEILGRLGHGGMGIVYKAHDRTLDEIVAIKVLRPDFARDPKQAERFRSEIKLARRIRHKNVCAIHDYGDDRDLLYISMELIEGSDVRQLVKKQGGLPAPQAFDVAIQVAEGLQAVHDAGIIHRDLKTPNIMVDAAGSARLMDFGIAKRQDSAGTTTGTGSIVGTPEYMSPEQAQGQDVDFRSDLYALGVVIFEIFTGDVPFRSEAPLSTILKHLREPPPLDGPQAARLPESLKPVLRKALAKDRADRHASAGELAAALRAARASMSRPQPPPTEILEPRTATSDATRPRAWLWGAGLAVVGVAVALQLRRPAAPEPARTPLPAPSPPIRVTPEPHTIELRRNTPAPAATPTPAPLAAPSAAPRRPTTSGGAIAPSPVAETPSPGATPQPRETAAAEEGFLLVAVKPWGRVSIDGKDIGETPIDKLQLSAGIHVVRIRNPGYEPIERRPLIQSGQTERVVVDLSKEGVKKP